MTLLILAGVALAQQYSFPTSGADVGTFYPTAYYDHSGADWNCGGITYSGHRGNDFGFGSFDGMYAGRDIVAAADGVVSYTNDGEYDECTTGDCAGGGGFGNYVKLQHADGKFTYYAHLKQWSVAVSAGQSVTCGQKLGEGGSSGYSTGPHLHFEVRDAAGNRIDSFHGSCSDSSGYWVDQGSYNGLPVLTCDDVPACDHEATLTCGMSVSTSNLGGSSDHWYYGCTEYSYSGPERAWAFRTDLSESVGVTLTGMSADLDLYALSSSACDGSGCLAASTNGEYSAGSAGADEAITFSATADHTYTLVVDGWEGATSDFTLSIACQGDLEDDEPAPADDTGETSVDDTGSSGVDEGFDPGDDGRGEVEPPGERWDQVPMSDLGCGSSERGGWEREQVGGGCSSAPGGVWLWGLVVVGLRRRGSMES